MKERANLDWLLGKILSPRLGHVLEPWPSEVYRTIEALARERGTDEVVVLSRLSQDPTNEDVDRLIAAASVTHTAFFRHPEQFSELERRLLERHRQVRGRPVRIWCAGCATGEEPYSVAICAERAGVEVSVLATDVNPEAIATARRGVYAARRSAGLPGHVPDQPWVAPASLRERIRFELRSLVDPEPAGRRAGFDFVLCRNVLIYFNDGLAARVHGLLYESLAPGGVLGLGQREAIRLTPRETGYETIDAEARLYRKTGQPTR